MQKCKAGIAVREATLVDNTMGETGYDRAYAAWKAEPQGWWEQAAEGITWDRKWDRSFDPGLGPFGQWFAGARLNVSYNCLDRHIAGGRGAQPALIWDSPMAG